MPARGARPHLEDAAVNQFTSCPGSAIARCTARAARLARDIASCVTSPTRASPRRPVPPTWPTRRSPRTPPTRQGWAVRLGRRPCPPAGRARGARRTLTALDNGRLRVRVGAIRFVTSMVDLAVSRELNAHQRPAPPQAATSCSPHDEPSNGRGGTSSATPSSLASVTPPRSPAWKPARTARHRLRGVNKGRRHRHPHHAASGTIARLRRRRTGTRNSSSRGRASHRAGPRRGAGTASSGVIRKTPSPTRPSSKAAHRFVPPGRLRWPWPTPAYGSTALTRRLTRAPAAARWSCRCCPRRCGHADPPRRPAGPPGERLLRTERRGRRRRVETLARPTASTRPSGRGPGLRAAGYARKAHRGRAGARLDQVADDGSGDIVVRIYEPPAAFATRRRSPCARGWPAPPCARSPLEDGLDADLTFARSPPTGRRPPPAPSHAGPVPAGRCASAVDRPTAARTAAPGIPTPGVAPSCRPHIIPANPSRRTTEDFPCSTRPSPPGPGRSWTTSPHCAARARRLGAQLQRASPTR